MINYDDFSKLDLKIAKIKKAEDHPNADKLVVLTIDVGDEEKSSEKILVEEGFNHFEKHLFFRDYLRLLKGVKLP